MTNVVKTEPGAGLHDHEIARRQAPGRLPSTLANSDPRGDAVIRKSGPDRPQRWLGRPSMNIVEARPDIVAKRQANPLKGK